MICAPAAVPAALVQVYAFLAEHYSRPLARVLFWAGAGPMMLVAIIIVGDWLSRLRHDGHVNGAWQMSPVGLYVAAVVGPIVDPRYTEICFWWFGFASIMYITLFIFTFQKMVSWCTRAAHKSGTHAHGLPQPVCCMETSPLLCACASAPASYELLKPYNLGS